MLSFTGINRQDAYKNANSDIKSSLVCIYVSDFQLFNIRKIKIINQSCWIESGAILENILSIEFIHCDLTFEKVRFSHIVSLLFFKCNLTVASAPMMYFENISSVMFADSQFILYDVTFADIPSSSSGALEFNLCDNIQFENCETKHIPLVVIYRIMSWKNNDESIITNINFIFNSINNVTLVHQ